MINFRSHEVIFNIFVLLLELEDDDNLPLFILLILFNSLYLSLNYINKLCNIHSCDISNIFFLF